MRAIIIDDEKHCREGLAIMLARYCPEVEVVEQCASGRTAIKMIGQHQPDLVFLDIEMPGMNGFEMLEYCTGFDFGIIFTTAYNEYAIKAIRHSALDYLLKPVNKAELVEAIERAKESKKVNVSAKITKLLESMNNKKTAGRIALPTLEGLIMVDIKDIMYCESENNYTRFHLQHDKAVFVSKTLKKAEMLLQDNSSFFRIHHSFLINLDYVKQYIKGDGGEVVMANGKSLAVSRTKRSEFLGKLEKLE
jgi:two-component system LytT family response regulator